MRYQIILFFILTLFCSCKKENKFKVVKNPSLSYMYKDNLRNDRFEFNIENDLCLLIVTDRNGKKHTQKEKVSRVIKFDDDSEDIVAKYLVNGDGNDHYLITEYLDRVEIKFGGYLERYKNPDSLNDYDWLGETMIAVKK